jgi:hypothetical protein
MVFPSSTRNRSRKRLLRDEQCSVISAPSPHLKSELLQFGGDLGRPVEIGVSKRSEVGVLVSVRRGEKRLGGIPPPIDRHDQVGRRPEAVLIEERLFTECLAFSSRSSDRILGSDVSDTHRLAIIHDSMRRLGPCGLGRTRETRDVCRSV